MESQIRFVDSQSFEPKPDLSPGQILVSSQGLKWRGLHLEKGENTRFNPDNVTVPQHYFALNIGQPFEWEWRDGQRFRTHRYESGDLWVNPAGVPFSHRINTYNQFVLLTLDPQKLVETLPDRPGLSQQVFRRQHKVQDAHLRLLVQALWVEAESNGVNGQLYVDSLATALVVHYVNHYGTEVVVDLPVGRTPERQRLGQVIDYIEAYLTENIALDDLAQVAGLSKFHFARLFKQAFGITPHRYLMQRRVEQAAAVLQQDQARQELSLSQVAQEFSFADQSHFTRVFKQVKQVTPKQFLRQLGQRYS